MCESTCDNPNCEMCLCDGSLDTYHAFKEFHNNNIADAIRLHNTTIQKVKLDKLVDLIE